MLKNKKRFSPWKIFGLGMTIVFSDVIISAIFNRQPDFPVILIASLMIPAAFIIPMIIGYNKRKRIISQGLPGTATLLSSRQTGTLVNNQPEMDLMVSVASGTGETWQTEIREIIPLNQLYALAPGNTFNIMYDPNNKNDVVIAPAGKNNINNNDNSYAKAGFMDIVMKQQQLFQRLSQTGISARARVLTYTPMGAVFNGNNPLITMTLEVQPEREETFTAQTNAVIGESSISKYQPGCMIYVKYDANDKTQVTITGSDRPDTAVKVDPPA